MKNTPQLTDRNLERAHKILFDVIEFLDKENIGYYLEGGTLLGIVRDNQLLPWDHDIDLSVSVNDSEKFAKKSHKLLFKGYRVTKRKMHDNIGGLKKGKFRVFKVKKLLPSLLKGIFPIAHKYMIVADIFVKADDDKYTYWQAMEKIMRVDKRYYSSFETVEYMGKAIRVPYDYKNYLTEKYGDWKTPIKEWSCGDDEKTVIKDAYND